ncbi:MazG family protein [Gordonia paraffinivorans]|uniref:Nucleoside triphosphate pyrophosphohydrolase n=1 Tax=Gordonia paraffinivorans TaxID=175628 RepID=A0ABD7V8F0_9ACTN|nr:MazG family protein [Gordonia paraffinivorans]MCD2147485.1 MazG family protein [Gordonia paraffinivorans]VFA90206.1 Nucleoside triphosphate pyrophosphohydrolase [Gordonia paraffinivorans]
MTVVLLDSVRPELIPLRACRYLRGPVRVTEDVPGTVLWEFDGVEAVFDEVLADTPPDSVLVSTDPDHRLVRARVARGEQVIDVRSVSGMALLESVALMDRLRRNGPWESMQTHRSLRRYLLEEVYELLDAIDAGDAAELEEELGDLLLQVLFHARIAADDPESPFDIDDVARSFTTKVMGRTPGVLSGAHSDLETQIREWEERKAAEKKRGSVLDGVATTQPALALLQKILERLTAASYPVDTIPAETWTVTVTADDDSVEAQARDRALALMESVRVAEARAKEQGVELDSRAAWESVLGN